MKRLDRRQFLHLAAGTAALPAASRMAWAQSYPSRPVRIIVGYAPGGTTDFAARLIGQWLSERLGQPFIIDNLPGAGSNVATGAELCTVSTLAVIAERTGSVKRFSSSTTRSSRSDSSSSPTTCPAFSTGSCDTSCTRMRL